MITNHLEDHVHGQSRLRQILISWLTMVQDAIKCRHNTINEVIKQLLRAVLVDLRDLVDNIS